MTSESHVQAPKGPSSVFISRIDHLALLLKHLPDSLPLNPTDSLYRFGLDPDDEREEGSNYAFNRNLEICFSTHQLQGNGLKLTEHGECYSTLIAMLKRVAKDLPDQRDFLREHWLERLIKAAQDAGAKIPDKCVHFQPRKFCDRT